MGLFSKVKELKQEAQRGMAALSTAGSLGEVSVPGETELELPVGTLRITYSQQPIKLRSYDEWFWKKPEIDLRVQGPGGEQIAVRRAEGVTVSQDPGGPRRSAYGTLEITEAGKYSIWTEPQDEWYRKPGLDPVLLFDADPEP